MEYIRAVWACKHSNYCRYSVQILSTGRIPRLDFTKGYHCRNVSGGVTLHLALLHLSFPSHS